MISEKNIFKFEKRRKIYQFVLNNPGLNKSELSREMNIPYTTLEHHLIYLKKRGFLVEKRKDKYARYYVVKEISYRDKELFNILRQDIPRRIVILLLYSRPSYWYPKVDYEKVLSASFESMVTFSRDELVEMERCCRPKKFAKLYSLKKHRTTINFHLNKLIEADIIEKVTSGKEVRYRLKDMLEIYIFLNRYKDALSYKIVDIAVPYIKNGFDQAIDLSLEIISDIFPHPYHA